MVRRLLLGLVLGLLVGGLVAAGLVGGVGIASFAGAGGVILAYLAAAVTGVLTGLVAGKPIWSSGAKVEAGLKALFGALAGAGLMFALRRWAGSWELQLPAGMGPSGIASVGDLPAVSLPLLAAMLGSFFEIDNTGADGGQSGGEGSKARRRVAAVREGDALAGKPIAKGVEADDEPEVVSSRAKR